MSIRQLRGIRELYFSHQDLSDLFGISSESAMVACSRYVRSGDLVRIKRNHYMLSERWERRTLEETFRIANILQVPSYISLTTALIYYGCTTQIQQDFVESVAAKRTREFQIRGTIFSFTKLKKEYYAGFVKKRGFFIATLEKAFIDAAYLETMGRYRLDSGSMDFSKFDKKKMREILAGYNEQVRHRVEDLCGT